MLKSSGRVIRTIDENGITLVSFDSHDAYFSAGADVAGALKQAEQLGLEVHFTYDMNLKIHGVVAHNG